MLPTPPRRLTATFYFQAIVLLGTVLFYILALLFIPFLLLALLLQMILGIGQLAIAFRHKRRYASVFHKRYLTYVLYYMLLVLVFILGLAMVNAEDEPTAVIAIFLFIVLPNSLGAWCLYHTKQLHNDPNYPPKLNNDFDNEILDDFSF